MNFKSEIEEAIVRTSLQIIKEPLMYFSEADIQWQLMEQLRRIPALQRLYPTSVPKGKGSKAHFSTLLVHQEYGGGEGRRIDIVIFSKKDVKRIDDVNLTHKGRYLIPEYAFELGTEKTINAKDHLTNDLNKLSRAKNTGYIIHFYKDTTQARSGTRSRENTEDRIQRKFKTVFETKKAQSTSNVKVLPILLRTYRHQVRMRGKCEIFDGERWIKRNIGKDSDLRAAILDQLR